MGRGGQAPDVPGRNGKARGGGELGEYRGRRHFVVDELGADDGGG